ncbi:MAG TPA: hypothetical protein VK203_00715 [Nostocaceae cyanobacterium]|nr:hypothetical protein [Nostocaceae cyanobacterium]
MDPTIIYQVFNAAKAGYSILKDDESELLKKIGNVEIKTALRLLDKDYISSVDKKSVLDRILNNLEAAYSYFDELAEEIKWYEVNKIIRAIFIGNNTRREIDRHSYCYAIEAFIAGCNMLKNEKETMKEHIDSSLNHFRQYSSLKTEFYRIQYDNAAGFSPQQGDYTGKIRQNYENKFNSLVLEIENERKELLTFINSLSPR